MFVHQCIQLEMNKKFETDAYINPEEDTDSTIKIHVL